LDPLISRNKALVLALAANVAGLAFAISQGMTNWLTSFLGGPTLALCPDKQMAGGEHCSPDFGIFYFLPKSNPWGVTEIPHPHPPFSQLVQTVFIELSTLIGADYWQAQLTWQALLLCCVYLGIVLAIAPSQGISARTFVLPLFFLPTLGPISALWTGNSVALVVPFLALASKGIILNTKTTWLWIAITLAIRPQFALLLLILLILGRYRQFIFASVATIVLTMGSLLYFPEDPIKLAINWLGNLISFPFYSSPFYFKPENLGIGRSVVKIPEFFVNVFGSGLGANDSSSEFQVFSSLLRELNSNRSLVLACLLVFVAMALAILRKRLNSISSYLSPFEMVLVAITSAIIVPSTSFTYYLVTLLPLTALLVSDSLFRPDSSITNSLSPFQKVLLVSLSLCFPVPFSVLRKNEELGLNGLFESFGLIVLLLLVTLVFRVVLGTKRFEIVRD